MDSMLCMKMEEIIIIDARENERLMGNSNGVRGTGKPEGECSLTMQPGGPV